VNKDSLYKPIERPARVFNTLKIPRALQAQLPFANKPKQAVKRREKSYESKRAVVMEPGERRLHSLMQKIHTIRNDKTAKRKQVSPRPAETNPTPSTPHARPSTPHARPSTPQSPRECPPQPRHAEHSERQQAAIASKAALQKRLAKKGESLEDYRKVAPRPIREASRLWPSNDCMAPRPLQSDASSSLRPNAPIFLTCISDATRLSVVAPLTHPSL